MGPFSKVIGASALILAGVLVSGSALAQYHGHGYGYGHGYGHGYGGNVRFGISLGVPLYWPGYYPAPYYAYPAYPYPAPAYAYAPVVTQPQTYVEQLPAQAAPAPAQAPADWYYCAESRAYYPYVNACPGGWQRVPAQPPSR